MNIQYIVNQTPEFDIENPYFQQALDEYTVIRNKFGEDGVQSFIDDICSIKACGCVDGESMLKCIHQFSNKRERKAAFNVYHNWKNNKKYTHKIANEDGDLEERECTQYIYHFERVYNRPKLEKGL